MEDQPRTSLNGSELVRSTFVVLIFARALAFVASFILVFVFAFLSPFGSEIFAFLFCNGEKRVVGGPEYDYVQYPEYAEKVEEYCSWEQERVLYWY